MSNTSPGLFEPDSGWPNTYLLMLGLFTVVNVTMFTLDTNLWQGSVNMVVYYHTLVDYFGGAAPFSILKAVLATEGWRSIMLLSERIRYRLRQEGREEGLEQGREEQANEDRAWYKRMRNAIERGEDFDEPLPVE